MKTRKLVNRILLLTAVFVLLTAGSVFAQTWSRSARFSSTLNQAWLPLKVTQNNTTLTITSTVNANGSSHSMTYKLYRIPTSTGIVYDAGVNLTRSWNGGIFTDKMQITVPAGSYSFCAWDNSAKYGSATIRYSITTDSGLQAPYKVVLTQGGYKDVTLTNSDGSNVYLYSATPTYGNVRCTLITRDTVRITAQGGYGSTDIVNVKSNDGQTAAIQVQIGGSSYKSVYLEYETVTLEAGETLNNYLTSSYGKVTSGVTWKSYDRDVATVRSGRITGEGYGSTKIRAYYNGKYYYCKVYVTQETPEFAASIIKYYPSTRTFRVKIKNYSDTDMVCYGSKAQLLSANGDNASYGTGSILRNLRFKNGNKIVVRAGKTVKAYLRIKGSGVASGLYRYEIQLNFKQDKIWYRMAIEDKYFAAQYTFRDTPSHWYAAR